MEKRKADRQREAEKEREKARRDEVKFLLCSLSQLVQIMTFKDEQRAGRRTLRSEDSSEDTQVCASSNIETI